MGILPYFTMKGGSVMPNYEFKCQNCQHQFSKMTSYKKKSEVTCPNCSSGNLQEVYQNCQPKKAIGGLRGLSQLSKRGFG